jgi:hypothetical protein
MVKKESNTQEGNRDIIMMVDGRLQQDNIMTKQEKDLKQLVYTFVSHKTEYIH